MVTLTHLVLLCRNRRQTAVALQAQQTHHRRREKVLLMKVPFLNQTQVFQLLQLVETMALPALPTPQLVMVMVMETQACQSLNPHQMVPQAFQPLQSRSQLWMLQLMVGIPLPVEAVIMAHRMYQLHRLQGASFPPMAVPLVFQALQ